MNARVRKMISEALASDGIEEIFKLGEAGASEIDIFGDDYLAKIAKVKLPNTKIKLLQQLLKRAIEDFKWKVNKIKGVDFTKQFQELVTLIHRLEPACRHQGRTQSRSHHPPRRERVSSRGSR